MPTRFARFDTSAPPPPMAEINTTPLIDVMLVLLIMMILTVPVTTHKVPLDLPQPTPMRADPPVHRLSIDAAGALAWNGVPLHAAQLGARLAAFRADAAAPVLHLRADAETPYVVVDETLAAVRRAGIDRLGFVDNTRFVW